MASIIKFGFTAIGETRTEVIDELDSQAALVLGSISGEPWLDIVDKVEKMAISPAALEGDPNAWIYRGEREVIFAGPTPLGPQKPQWRDGYKPQSGSNDDL